MYDLLKKTFFLCLYVTGLWRLIRLANRRSLAILMYHGVTPSDAGVWTQVTTENFERQMAYIRRAYKPIALDEAVDLLSRGALGERAVAVTFDDGFRNNMTEALPILKRYAVPATIYLTTSFVGGTGQYAGMIWTDYVFALLMSTEHKHLDLQDFGLNVVQLSDRTSRIAAKEVICSRFKRLSDSERKRALATLAERTGGTPKPDILSTFLPMSWDEVRRIATEPLISLGAHTVEHPILTQLPRDRMMQEISESQARIEIETGRGPASFAYPNGTREDFDDSVKAAVAERYANAVTTIEGFNDGATDRYELRRFGIGSDMAFWQFKLRLSGTVNLLERLLGRS